MPRKNYFALALVWVAAPLLAQGIEAFPSSLMGLRVIDEWSPNPSVSASKASRFSFYQEQIKRDIEIVPRPEDGEADGAFLSQGDTKGLSLQWPFDGISFGLGLRMNTTNDLAWLASQDRRSEESTKVTHVLAKALVPLSGDVDVAFGYEFEELKKAVLGNIGARANNRINYLSQLKSYRLGLYYHESEIQGGIYFVAPLKGKTHLAEEVKMIALPGSLGLHLNGPWGMARWGLNYTRFVHRVDERRQDYQNLIVSRRTRLIGLDPEQNYLSLEAYGVGLRSKITELFPWAIEYQWDRKHSINQFDEVPKSDAKAQQKFSVHHFLAEFGFDWSEVHLALIYHLRRLSESPLVEPAAVFGYRNLKRIQSTQSSILIGLNWSRI